MMSDNVRLQAWAPDADPTTPGVIADGSNIIPSVRGYSPDFSAAIPVYYKAPLTDIPRGAISMHYQGSFTTAGSIVVGTSTKLYTISESSASVFDATGTSSVAVSGLAYNSHAFCIWSDSVYNVSGVGSIRTKTVGNTSTFSDISGSPTAATITSSHGHIIVGNLYGTTGFSYNDGWACSKVEDPTNWTPDIATGAARGRLTVTPGAIIKMYPFKDYVLAFKGRSLYRGTYVGPQANTFEWPVISTNIGIVGPNAIAEADDVLYWMAEDGIYRFDGSSLQRIQSAPWRWWTDQMNAAAYLTETQWDAARRVVRFYCSGSASSVPSKFNFGVAYHPETDRWGLFDAIGYTTVTLPKDDSQSITSPTKRGIFYDAAAYFDASYQLKSFRGAPGTSTIITGDIGSDDDMVLLKRARLRMTTAPATAQAQHFYRMVLSDPLQVGYSATINDGKFDVAMSSRWHRLKFTMTDAYELLGFSVDTDPAGKR